MLWIMRHFGKTLGGALLLLGVYWLPADLMNAGEALGPWQKAVGIVDREVALLSITIAVFIWLAWSELKPVLVERFFMPKWQRPVRGKPPAYLRVGVDRGSKAPRMSERFNICSFYLTEFAPLHYLMIVFEKDVGIEHLTLTRGDGTPIGHKWVDVGPRSVIAHITDKIKMDGLIFHCANGDDRAMAPREIPAAPQSLPSIAAETPPKIPLD